MANERQSDPAGDPMAQEIPPRGWQLPPQDRPAEEEPLAQLIEQLLALVPDDLRQRLTEAVRQLLEALRALIDWCVQRLERRVAEPPKVRDIPIL